MQFGLLNPGNKTLFEGEFIWGYKDELEKVLFELNDFCFVEKFRAFGEVIL